MEVFAPDQIVLIVAEILLGNRCIRKEEKVEEPVAENVFARGDVSIVISAQSSSKKQSVKIKQKS